jgi:4-hydroxymandelate synthase
LVLLTEGLDPEGPVAGYVRRHGDGVRDIALRSRDAVADFELAVRRGARPVEEPVVVEDGRGRRLVRAAVAGMGDVVHSLIQRDGPRDFFVPERFRALASGPVPTRELVSSLDHLAICLAPGTLDETARFYQEVFGYRVTHEENVRTRKSGMNSKVVQSASGRVCLPMQEPATGESPGQIAEFLAAHGGPGVQHVAMLTPDIASSVRALSQRSLEFLEIPSTYYEVLESRLGQLGLDVGVLRELGILVDRDEWGLLMQAFTRSRHSRGTLFFEMVERKDARGFGGANIRALFEAVEREHARRVA